MGFVVLPALVTDISSVYDVYFAAFQHNAITRALFPSATKQDLLDSGSEFRKAHTAHTFQYWQGSESQYTVKCVDSETGAVVGMALWDVYLTPSSWKRGSISWLEGAEKQRAEAFISPLWNTREKLWTGEKYLYCHIIAVQPEFQRRGVGELLFGFGARVAEQSGLPIYIESSKEAERLYAKMGGKLLKERPVHKAEDMWPGEVNEAKKDCGVALFVWTSRSTDELPEAVKLA